MKPMSARAVIGLAIGTAVIAGCRPSNRPGPVTWFGDLRHPRATLPLEIVVDSSGTAARVSNRLWRLDAAPATVRLEGDSGIVTIASGADPVRLVGVRHPDRWVGEAFRGDEKVPFELVRVDPEGSVRAEDAIGTYRAGDGRLIGIGRFTEFGARPMLVDYQTGRIGPLVAIGSSRLLLGHSLVAPLFPPDTVEIVTGNDGVVDEVRLGGPGREPFRATRVAVRDTAVTFANEEVTLAGTLSLPPTPGPHPAMVLVHGSNAQTRDAFGPWTRYFTALGFAVLAFDKRGTGGSSGDWKQADFAVLAGDVEAAVRALRGRSDIRRDRIGLWGISQAGWIMPLVAAAMPDTIAFMVVHAGTGTTVREQGILNYRNELRFAGLPDRAVDLGVRYRRLDDSVTMGQLPLAALERFYRSHLGEAPWLDEPAPVDSWFRGYYRMLIDFDPRAAWSRVRCPVLLFFGELDANVPPVESWPPIERALLLGHNDRVTQHVLPKANHLFLEAGTGGGDEYPHLRRFVAGYFDRMARWLEPFAR